MFTQLALLATAATAATAITFNTPTNVHSGDTITISFTSASTDPSTFSIELVNAPLLGNEIAIANNVQTSSGSATASIPVVPSADNYTIVAVDISNINNVFGTSGAFGVTQPASSSASSSSSSSAASSSASGSSAATGASSGSSAATSAASSGSAASSATTHFISATSSAASAASSGASSASGSAAAASSSSANFNAAAGMHSNMYFVGSCAVAAAGAVAVLAGFAL